MKAKRHATGEEPEIDLTPMLDVVFIMLIFFIVTASFIKEAGIDVTRPEAETALVQERANIVVGVNENNAIWINRREVAANAVRTTIERLYAENPQGSVVIMGDAKADIATIIQVMDAARDAGVTNVSIATDPD